MKRFLISQEEPSVAPSAFVAPGAVVIGGVEVGDCSSIWYGCVLRGDINRIRVGHRTNVQDGVIMHVADDYEAVLGDEVSVGHRAVVHACQIGHQTLIGMSATILDGSEIGPRCIIGAGALVTKNTKAPEGSLILGAPARVVRTLTLEEQKKNADLAAKYVTVSRLYLEQGTGRWSAERGRVA